MIPWLFVQGNWDNSALVILAQSSMGLSRGIVTVTTYAVLMRLCSEALEGFMFATSLDLNMGYYHIQLTPFSSRLCTIVLPWGKYEYLRLPMGLKNSPDIFQEKMSDLMAGLEFVRVYIDDMLCITNRIKELNTNKETKKFSFASNSYEFIIAQPV